MSDYAVETNKSKVSPQISREEYLSLGRSKLVGMFHTMVLIRRFEEASAKMYSMQKIGGFLHLYIGQEAVAVGGSISYKRRRLFDNCISRPWSCNCAWYGSEIADGRIVREIYWYKQRQRRVDALF